MSDDLVKRLLEPVIDTFFGPVIEPIKKEAASRIENLEAALKFYASNKNYKQIWHEKRQMWVSDIASDQGKIARKALEGKDG